MATAKRCPDFAAILGNTAPDAELREQVATCFGEELSRQAYRRCRDATLAEDAAQDALVIAFQSLGTFRGDAPIDHWLKRLVVSACSRLRRGRKNDPKFNRPLDEVSPTGPAHAGEANPEAEVFLKERISLLQDALAEVDEHNRELLLLHEGQEIPLADLAARFDTTVDGVKARLKRTRARLRVRLIELSEADAPSKK